MDCSSRASLSFTISWSLLKLMSIESVMPSSHLVLCRPLFLLTSIFASIMVFSNESACCFRWPKYCKEYKLTFIVQEYKKEFYVEYKSGPAKRNQWGDVWKGPKFKASVSSGFVALSSPSMCVLAREGHLSSGYPEALLGLHYFWLIELLGKVVAK